MLHKKNNSAKYSSLLHLHLLLWGYVQKSLPYNLSYFTSSLQLIFNEKKDCSRVGKKFFTPWAPWALGFPSLPELFKSSSSLREVLMLCCNIHQCLSWIWDPSFCGEGASLPLPHPALPLVQLKLYYSHIFNEPVLNILVTFHCSIL